MNTGNCKFRFEDLDWEKMNKQNIRIFDFIKYLGIEIPSKPLNKEEAKKIFESDIKITEKLLAGACLVNIKKSSEAEPVYAFLNRHSGSQINNFFIDVLIKNYQRIANEEINLANNPKEILEVNTFDSLSLKKELEVKRGENIINRIKAKMLSEEMLNMIADEPQIYGDMEILIKCLEFLKNFKNPQEKLQKIMPAIKLAIGKNQNSPLFSMVTEICAVQSCDLFQEDLLTEIEHISCEQIIKSLKYAKTGSKIEEKLQEKLKEKIIILSAERDNIKRIQFLKELLILKIERKLIFQFAENIAEDPLALPVINDILDALKDYNDKSAERKIYEKVALNCLL